MTKETANPEPANVENITRLQEQILRQEDADVKFHMASWVNDYHTEYDENPPEWLPDDFCGTCACIRGQIDLLKGMSEKEARRKVVQINFDDYIQEGANFLGLDYRVAYLLFLPWRTKGLSNLDRPNSISPHDAVAALEILKTNPTYGPLLEHWRGLARR